MLESPFTLPCGQVLKNRLIKAAMTEGVADARNRASARHVELYRRWADTGACVLITGNVMIDAGVLERPGNIVIDPSRAWTIDTEARTRLRAMAQAGSANGTHVWMQISHAGRQSPRYVTSRPRAPSPVSVGLLGLYAKPEALSEDAIHELIDRFARVAEIARDTGFSGVQIHSAHGYLLSSFLSPISNRRQDRFGGSIDNRARFLIETLRATRARVGADFAVTVKLNSDDFRKGGFSHQDCLDVVRLLNAESIDLLEISGGTYEQPRLLGFEGKPDSVVALRPSTRLREAYFLDYAEQIRKLATMPLMVTGGFRSLAGINEALRSQACDLIGIARPFCTHPELIAPLLSGVCQELPAPEREHFLARRGWLSPSSPFTLGRVLNVIGSVGWYYHQIFRLADGLAPELHRGLLRSFGQHWLRELGAAWRLRGARRAQKKPRD